MQILRGLAMLRRVMQALYFAYGSNLARRRMRERVPGAQTRGRALLLGWRLVADKPGRDGSGKVNLVREAGGRVWGALWELREEALVVLDGFEGGYARVAVGVRTRRGLRDAITYVSTLHAARPGLARGYKALVLEGARERRLPPDWIALLEGLPELSSGTPPPAPGSPRAAPDRLRTRGRSGRR
jgi:gamma-glutamylcyclotransferase (GGCT)/AIG2-like uncharacterized protein YtfP